MMLASGVRKTLLKLLLVWIVVSALYYIEHLFSPSYYMGYDEGTAHKVVKYLVCVFFTVAFCVVARAYVLLLSVAFTIGVAAYFVLNRGALEISTLSMLIAATMVAFASVPSIWEKDLRLIGRVTVYAGAVVGVFSIIELTVLAILFQSNWASTGAIRSVSTMFNPNNLGLYAGACLVLLPHLGLRLVPLSVCGALVFFAFAASGSRTAWVSVVAVLAYQFLASMRFRLSVKRLLRRHSLRLIVIGIALTAVFTVFQTFREQPDIEVVHRGTDLYTASIRWENFIRFIEAIDVGILIPDFTGERADFIQDNFYLVVLNSFGAVGVMFFLAFFTANFAPRRSVNPDMTPWKLVFAYYMVSGLSGSQLNSFPNNQLFFLSMGSLYVLRPLLSRVRIPKPKPPTGPRQNSESRSLSSQPSIPSFK